MKDMTKKCEEFSQKVSNVEKMFEEMSKEKKLLLELDKEQRRRLLEVLVQSDIRFPCLGPVVTKLGQMVEKEDVEVSEEDYEEYGAILETEIDDK